MWLHTFMCNLPRDRAIRRAVEYFRPSPPVRLMPSTTYTRSSVSMQVGCGFKVHHINGHDYLYFWHYEPNGGRRKQVQEYVGPARDPESRSQAIRRMGAYYDRCLAEVQRRRSLLSRVARP